MQFDKGYLSPYFVTDPESDGGGARRPLVLLHREKITAIADLLPPLEEVLGEGRPLLIVAEDVEGEALSTLVVNPGARPWTASGEGAVLRRPARGVLDDLAIATGGQVVNPMSA